MTSLLSEIVKDTASKYSVTLKFNLNVNEYLKGSGASNIVAVWVYSHSFDTHLEAENVKKTILERRDDQWDDREAVIFMYEDGVGFGKLLDNELQRADHFLISTEDPYSSDDLYSLHSKQDKKWLPASNSDSVSEASSTDDQKEFLLDIPLQSVGALSTDSSNAAPTIALGDLKKRIKDVTSEFNGGDKSDAYKRCITMKYELQQSARYFKDIHGEKPYPNLLETSTLRSGQPANTVIHTRDWSGNYPEVRAKTWFGGEHAALISVAHGDTLTPYDRDLDGKLIPRIDGIKYTETFKTTRPLPASVYKIDRKEVWAEFLPCNYTLSHDWTITATAPVGAVHEAFFDPVNLTGGAIGADKDNGALKPTAFSVNGAATKIERIKWDPSGRVSMDLKPGVSLKGHLIEFIGLNGKPIRSLSFDRSSGTSAAPSWQVCDSPWKAGDLLMIRISAGATAFGEAAKVSPCPNAATPTPTPKTPAGRG